jgi:hypothetical protein
LVKIAEISHAFVEENRREEPEECDQPLAPVKGAKDEKDDEEKEKAGNDRDADEGGKAEHESRFINVVEHLFFPVCVKQPENGEENEYVGDDLRNKLVRLHGSDGKQQVNEHGKIILLVHYFLVHSDEAYKNHAYNNEEIAEKNEEPGMRYFLDKIVVKKVRITVVFDVVRRKKVEDNGDEEKSCKSGYCTPGTLI